MKGSRKLVVEHFQQRGEIFIARLDAEHAGAAIAEERLDDDVAELRAERADFARDRG